MSKRLNPGNKRAAIQGFKKNVKAIMDIIPISIQIDFKKSNFPLFNMKLPNAPIPKE